MYEIITRDDHFRCVPHTEQNVKNLEEIEWVKHPGVELDHPVSDCCSVVMRWAKGRERRHVSMCTEAPKCIDWEAIKPPAGEGDAIRNPREGYVYRRVRPLERRKTGQLSDGRGRCRRTSKTNVMF